MSMNCKLYDTVTKTSLCDQTMICLYHNCTKFSPIETNAYIRNLEWHPIATAPEATWIEVIGNCQMIGEPSHFIHIAKKDPTYRPLDPWRDRQNYPLSDSGYVPVYWRKLQPVPKV
jgi:hypothetical protein